MCRCQEQLGGVEFSRHSGKDWRGDNADYSGGDDGGGEDQAERNRRIGAL